MSENHNALSADFWRAEYYKAKQDNVALHKGVRRLKRSNVELRASVAYADKLLAELERTAPDAVRDAIFTVFPAGAQDAE